MKIGLLSTLNHPLLPHYLYNIFNTGLTDIVIICDKKGLSESDIERIHQRTNNQFRSLQNSDPWEFVYNNIAYPMYLVENHNSKKSLTIINDLGLECLANCGTPRKLSKDLLSSIRTGVVNVHPGSLPQYRGCSSVEWALFNKDTLANTAHIMSEEYDAGPIINIETYEKSEFNSYQSVRIFMYEKALNLMAKTLKDMNTNNFTLTVQDESKAKTWKPIEQDKLMKVMGRLNNHSVIEGN